MREGLALKMRRAGLALAMCVVALSAAGCFRPSGTEMIPTAQTGAQPMIPVTPLATELANPLEGFSSDAAATLGVTVISGSPAGTPSLAPTAGITLVAVTSTPAFITPQIPLGPVTPDTPVPTATLQATVPLAPGTSTPSGLITPTSMPGLDDPCVVIVQPGDSAYAIAIANEVALDALLAANPDLVGDPPVLQPGDMLRLPACGTLTPAAPVTAIATLRPFSAETATPAGAQTYTVRSGDTLFDIAQRFNTTVSAIVQANNLANPNALRIGQQLVIPQ